MVKKAKAKPKAKPKPTAPGGGGGGSTAPPVTIIKSSGGSWENPTIIKVPGNVSTLVVFVDQSGQGSVFKLQPNFQIGDVVEIYLDPTASTVTVGMLILDENGNDISPQYGTSGTIGRGYILRKVYNGPGYNWVRSF